MSTLWPDLQAFRAQGAPCEDSSVLPRIFHLSNYPRFQSHVNQCHAMTRHVKNSLACPLCPVLLSFPSGNRWDIPRLCHLVRVLCNKTHRVKTAETYITCAHLRKWLFAYP